MKNILPVFFLALLITGCKNNTGNNAGNAPASGVKPVPYFSFDEVTCYIADFNNPAADTLNAEEHRSPFDSLKKSVLLNNTPASLTDTSFIIQLEKMGFHKKPIDTAYLAEIASIFSQKPNLGSVKAGCPVVLYHHILIFRKNGAISGMAKINFRCTKQQVTGTTVNTDYFGQNGDYERLEELLEK